MNCDLLKPCHFSANQQIKFISWFTACRGFLVERNLVIIIDLRGKKSLLKMNLAIESREHQMNFQLCCITDWDISATQNKSLFITPKN